MPEVKLNVVLLQHTPDPAETIALAGRLCYSGSDISSLYDKSKGTADQFVQKLLDLGHLSPIEHVSFTFGVEGVSRALLAQITRHRVASFSVQSQRYVKKSDFEYIIPDTVKALGDDAKAEFESQMAQLQKWYTKWQDAGIPAEDARFVLPNAAETRMVFTMNARELIHFFGLRCCNRAQWEIRALAWTMLGIVRREFPGLFAKKGGPSCVTCGRCSEGKMSCGKAAQMQLISDRLNELCDSGASDEEIRRFVEENVR